MFAAGRAELLVDRGGFSSRERSMFGTLIVTAVEVSIITLEASTAMAMQMQKMLRNGQAVRSEADLMRDKLVALQQAFTDAVSIPAKTGEDLRSVIRANYERLTSSRTD
jgi:hypothetical protein